MVSGELRVRLERHLVWQPSGCLVWTGYVNQKGYGRIGVNGRLLRTHRLAWSLANDQPVPEGKMILHSCDNPPCCEPSHLRPGTQAENTADMIARGRNHNQQVTICPRGHEYTTENTYVNRRGRSCRTCGIDQDRARRATRKIT